MRTADISSDKLMDFLQYLADNGYELLSVKHATNTKGYTVANDYAVEFDRIVIRAGGQNE